MGREMNDADKERAGIGDNIPPLDQQSFDRFVSAIMRNRNGPLALAKAQVKAAMKIEKNIKADFKKAKGKLVQLEAYLKLREMDDEDGAAENAEAFIQYCQWGGLEVGEQGDLFEGLSPTPSERQDMWYRRGFDDIRYGAIDPEGYKNPLTGKLEPGPIFPGTAPSYVAPEGIPQWLLGAGDANEQNMREWAEEQEAKANTPVEEAAKGKKGKAKDEPKTSTLEQDADAGKATADEFAGETIQ